MRRSSQLLLPIAVVSSLMVACTIQPADDDGAGGASGSGQAGTTASAGSTGLSGSAGASGDAGGKGGSAGSLAQGGSAGQAGASAGSAGTSGGQAGSTAGQAGSSAGQAGSSAGMAGTSAGQAGTSAGQGGSSAGAAGAAAGQGGSSAGQGGSSAGQGGSGGAGAAGLSVCTDATVFSGDPANDEDPLGQSPTGHPLLASPPLRFHDIAIHGDELAVSNQSELWVADLSAASAAYKRLVGRHDIDGYKIGPCGEALLYSVNGIAALPNGDWVLAEFSGNAVLRVTSPNTPACNVEVLAGNAVPFAGNMPTPTLPGDVDGPGAAARFNGPGDIASDEQGTIFFFDKGNAKVRRIANDAAHTVSTVADLESGPLASLVLVGLTALNDTAYLVGYRKSGGDVVVKVTGAGQITMIVDSEKAFDGYVASNAGLNAATNDGTSLYAVGSSGRIWKVSTTGTVSPFLAGGGKDSSLSATKYDFSKPFPAKEAPMYGLGPFVGTLALWKGSLLTPSVAGSLGYFLYRFACKE